MASFVVDARPLNEVHSHGITVYLRNLLREMTHLDKKNRYSLLLDSRPRDGFPEFGPHVKVVHIPRLRGLGRLTGNPAAWWEVVIPSWLALKRPDAVLGHAYTRPPRLYTGAYVVYVFDTGCLELPTLHSDEHRARISRNAAPALRRADLILAISETTREAVIRRYGIAPDKIHAIPLAYDRNRFNADRDEASISAVTKRYGVTEPYIMFIGRNEPRKNVPNLVRAFGRLKRSRPTPHKLVLAGQQTRAYEATAKVIQEHGLQDDVVLPGFVPDDDLPHLLRGADLFVFPSLYEGFGIPVLESMACGVPVVASNVTSLPEVAGDAAVLVDPHDVGALADGMARVIHDPSIRSELVQKGLLRAQEFSWIRTARRTLDLVNGLL